MRNILHLAFFIAILFTGMIGLSTSLHAQQSWHWAKGFGGANNDYVTGMGTDRAGNVYVVGTFDKTIRFNSTTLNNGNATGLFVAKYSQKGDLRWAVAGTGSGDYVEPSIAVDTYGDCYITGAFSGGATLGSTTLESVGDADMFVAKCDSNGNFLWARRAGGAQADFGRGIAIDSSASPAIYITGSFRGLATFGAFDVVSAGIWDVFVAKYTTDGAPVWVKGWGGPQTDNSFGIAMDRIGNAYITGDFVGTAQFGATTLQNAGPAPGTDIFVAKIGPTGDAIWARRAGSVNSDRGIGIATDARGNSHVTGFYIGQATFGTFNIDGYGLPDMFIAKYDRDGTAKWVRSGGGGGQDMGFDVTLDQQGNSYVTGRYEGEFTEAYFGGVRLTEAGNGDAFVVSYDSTGAPQWTQRAGSAEFDQGTAIVADWQGNIAVAGTIAAAGLFDAISVGAPGLSDGFVARVGPAAAVSTGTILPAAFCAGQAISIPFTAVGLFNEGNIFTAQLSDASGSFASPVILGTQAGTTSGTISGTAPGSIPEGTRYRIRVVASNPSVTGAPNGADLSFGGTVAPVIAADGPLSFCDGDSVTLDAGEGYTGYLWSNGATTRSITVQAAGSYSVQVTNGTGCNGTSQPVVVILLPRPATPTITQNGPLLESSDAHAYQWLLNDVEITGATSRQYTATVTGQYRVRVRNAAGCTALSDAVNVAVSSVGDRELANELKLYPQPTTGEFTLELPASAGRMVRVIVRNGLGEELLRLEEPGNGGIYRRMVDLSGLSAGVYHVEVESGGGRWNRQVVKK